MIKHVKNDLQMKANANQGPYEACHKARNDMVRAQTVSQLHVKREIEIEPHMYFTAWSVPVTYDVMHLLEIEMI